MKQTLQLTFALFIFSGSLFSQDFARIGEQAGIDHLHVDEHIMGGGASFFDFNNDGFIDIYVTGGDEMDKLYKNNGDLSFTDVGVIAGFSVTDGIKTTGVCTGDIDNDGDRDIFVATNENAACLLFENQGDGTFLNISTTAGIIDTSWSTSITMGDYNMDGYLDIYVGNYVKTYGAEDTPFYDQIEEALPNYFYINNGDNTFSQDASLTGVNDIGAALAVAFTDYDNDNDIDIYVANDFGNAYDDNTMYQNEYPSSTFANVGVAIGADASMNAMGIAIGDYNESMNLDYYVSNMAGNVFYSNSGDNNFVDVATATNTLCTEFVSWGNFFFDYNHDTYLDLFVANGGVLMQDAFRDQANTLFKAQDDYTYIELLDFTGDIDSSISRGAIFGDIDNDGDLDIFVANMSDDSSATIGAFLIENLNESSFNWIKIRTEGTTNNFDGFGTKVKMHVNGRSFIREVDGGSSYQSQNSSIVHFGLGESTVIDSLEVVWLGGETQTLYNVAANQMIHVKEGNVYNFTYNQICEGDSIYFNEEWISMEGTYYDTASSSMGSDSVIALYISPVAEFYIESEITIIEGDSLFLEGEYQSMEGVYTDVYSTTSGCDSTVVTTLSIDFSSGISELNNSNWIVYPNPSNGVFNLDFNESVFVNQIEIYSILGKQVGRELVNDSIENMEFNLLDQPEGIYFITVRSNSETYTLRIILNK